jgi:tyrosine phenol-lyase
MAKYPFEPFRTKVVEPIRMTTKAERARILEEAGYNVISVKAEDVLIDFLTDSGTSAMSDNQWAGMMLGDESYAGCRNFYHLEKVQRTIFGMPYFVPIHQGRAAENVLANAMLRPGHVVPNNMHFDTTEANIQAQGARPVNLNIDEGWDTTFQHPFKGNMDIDKLRRCLDDTGLEHVPMIMLTLTNNTAAGQPVSLENIRATKAVAAEYGIPLWFDAARYAENAYFIKLREPGYADKTPLEIAQEMFSYADGFVMSSKKDGLVNMGGLLGCRDPKLFERVKVQLILREGFPTYGGLAGRDLEALARGLLEGVEESYLKYRIEQTRYLGERLAQAGVPIFEPVGGHAVYLDMKRFLPHIPQSQFPGMAFTCRLYLDYGIRAVELGSLIFATKDPETGEEVYPLLELVRLALPRRVYGQRHVDYVADAVIELHEKQAEIKGLRITWEAEIMRHFTARLEPIEASGTN